MGVDTGDPNARRTIDARRFWVVLGLIVVAALGVRIAFVVTVARHDSAFYDAFYYELQADANADGKWFTNPFPFIEHPEPNRSEEHNAGECKPLALDLDDEILAVVAY